MGLKSKIDAMSRDELNQLAMKINLTGFRKLKIEELRSELSNSPEANKLLKQINLGKHGAHFYGIVGILIGLVGVGLTIFYSSSISSNSTSPFKLAKEHEVSKRVNRLLSEAPYVISEPNKNRKPGKKIADKKNQNYELIERSFLWDLRKWRHVEPIDLIKPTSPLVSSARYRVKKISASDHYDVIRMTSGYDVYSECEEPSKNCEVTAGQNRISVGGTILKPRLIRMDTSNIPVGKEFDLKTRSTYWNGVQSKEQSWVGVAVREREYKISMLVILPDRKLFKDFKFSVARLNGKEKFPYGGEQLVLGDSMRRYIYWEILNPDIGYVYRIDWDQIDN